MDVLVFLVCVAVLVLFVFIKETVNKRKEKRLFTESLHRDYGKPVSKSYSPDRFVRISGYYKKHIQDGMIDDITWNDLDMDEIFKKINYTFSATGEEYLYYTLRNTGKTVEELLHQEAIIAYFEKNENERVRFQSLMKELGYTGKFSLYDYIDNLDYLGSRSNVKHIICDVLLLLLIAVLPVWFTPALTAVLLLAAYNIISYFREKNEIEPYITSFAYIIRLMDVSKKLVGEKFPACCRELEALHMHYNNLKEIRTGSFIVFSGNKVISSGNPLEIIFDYLRMVFHLDLIQFNRMLSHLREHKQDIDGLITLIGYLEMTVAVGAFRKSLPEFCLPEFTRTSSGVDGNCPASFTVENAYHPRMPEAVRNSISTEKGVLITGSNASGKSTFLKTLASNAVLAQTIHTCTARMYKAPLYRIYSSMSLRDDISKGESYYIVEIKAIKRIIDAWREGEKILCVVDEVLRGTNTVERISASTQILKSLSEKGILCFAATHDVELTELLKASFDNYHFEEEIIDGDIIFHYQLLPGKAITRNAIKLLQLMGFEQEIINKAMLQAELFAEKGVWTRTDV